MVVARKSKGFNELLQQKQHEEKAATQSFRRLQQKAKQVGRNDPQEMVMNPKGVAKMSEVLEKFIEPYKDTTQDFADLEALIEIAILAWNMSLIPKENRKDAMESMLSEMNSGANQPGQSEFLSMLNELIDRKDRHFSKNQRFITTFDLQDTGDGYHLSVASTLQA